MNVLEESVSRLGRRGDPDRFGPYLVVDSIASGGMAQIYKVRHQDEPDRWYALKCIRQDCDDDPEFRRMLLDEARITGQLDHPSINTVLEVVHANGRVALLLEHVEGIDLVGLKRYLRKRSETLPLSLVLHILREVLGALDYAHRARGLDGRPLNIVHRDVSPGNVMLDIHGRVMLIDFGIARAQGRLAKTEVGSVKGKFRYMAPEQIKGAEVGAHADIYAAGVLLWELLSGRRIHEDIAVAHLMTRVANAEVPALTEARPGVPEALSTLYSRATALSPSDRFATAGEFADAIGALMKDVDPTECKRALANYALQGSSIDHAKSYQDAISRARKVDEDDLEDAILSALEEPDRVERFELEGVRRAEPSVPDVGDEDVTEYETVDPAQPAPVDPPTVQFDVDPPTVPIRSDQRPPTDPEA